MARKNSSASNFSLLDGLDFEREPEQAAPDVTATAEPKYESEQTSSKEDYNLAKKGGAEKPKKSTGSTPSDEGEDIVGINLRVPRKLRNQLRLRHAQTGEATTQYIRRLIEADIKKYMEM